MSLFDKLPLHISEIIYKLSLRDHIDGMLENVYKFHLNHGKKRNSFKYVKYRKIERFTKAVKRVIEKQTKISEKDPKTIKDLQDSMFWYDVACNIVMKNIDLVMKVYPRSKLIKFTQNKIANRFISYRDAFAY